MIHHLEGFYQQIFVNNQTAAEKYDIIYKNKFGGKNNAFNKKRIC